MRIIQFLVLSMSLFFSVSSFAGPVDINSADAGMLAGAISGVGESRASAIIEYRNTHGPFASVDELGKVKGIGMKTIEKSRKNLTVLLPEGR